MAKSSNAANQAKNAKANQGVFKLSKAGHLNPYKGPVSTMSFGKDPARKPKVEHLYGKFNIPKI